MFCNVIRAAALAFMASLSLHAAQFVTDTNGTAPKVAAASDEAERAIQRFRIPKGFRVELFAAEPLLANPVAFAIDEKGRFFVAETFRLHAGVTDIRGHMNWLTNELASQSVEERVSYMKHYEGKRAVDYTKESDRVRLVWDNDGDGKADRATVFADGFNGIAEGLGAGLLARRGNVYYTDIPNLWLFRDDNKDSMADSKKSLLYGFGVREGFLGHDLHGLRIGPDGKLYFTIGDRGARVITKEGTREKIVANQEEGVVYRCNLDGSEFEIYARGLRNPQELAFDAFGNLWTGDNNSDGGDPARWVYVVEGGDSGWRVGYQFLTPQNSPNSRGVWLGERMCYPHWPGQPAFIVPPIANIGNGPSGLAYYPGTGLSDRYANHFFLCDFRGSSDSGVHAFSVRPRGAGFEVTDRHPFVWELLATDGDFGYDGCFYISDWVQGWNKTGKGRIYRVFDPEFVKDRAVKETKELFAQGFDKMGVHKLAALLEHPDMRVRQEAQFALVEQGPVTAATTFTNIVRGSANQFARLHAIWGLGQIAVRSRLAVSELMRSLDDKDAEVRAQSAKVLGEARAGNASVIIRLLADDSPRVRFFAAMALSKFGEREMLPPLVTMLRASGDEDPYLRHASVMALTSIVRHIDPSPGMSFLTITDAPPSGRWTSPEAVKVQKALTETMNDPSDAVRMATLLALRRVESPDIAQFLRDPNPLLVAEAARAINDLPIAGALPKLAALIESDDILLALPVGDAKQPGPRDWLLRRVINANYRVGGSNNAMALATFATTSKAPEAFRAEALTLLGEWAKSSGLDRITGLWRPLPQREPEIAAAALQPHLASLQRSSSDALKLAATKVAGVLNIKNSGLDPIDIVNDLNAAPNLRVEALKSMAINHDPKLAEAVRLSLADKHEALRKEATRIQAQMQPNDALAQLRLTLANENSSIAEKQNAFATLGTLPAPEVDELLSQWLDKLLAKDVKPELTLDLLDASAKRESPIVKDKLRRVEVARPAADDLRSYRECLVGGDAEEGKKVFLEKVEASCVRCHKYNGEGGEVGPDLAGIGSRYDRQYLLESLVFPNKQIAQGFESAVVTLKNGTAYAGVLKSESPEILEINSPEDGLIQLKKIEIKARERGLSAMPEELRQVLSKQDLRNLVEFLAQSKADTAAAK
jgi:quinoprotein glucose dehydrogenase